MKNKIVNVHGTAEEYLRNLRITSVLVVVVLFVLFNIGRFVQEKQSTAIYRYGFNEVCTTEPMPQPDTLTQLEIGDFSSYHTDQNNRQFEVKHPMFFFFRDTCRTRFWGSPEMKDIHVVADEKPAEHPHFMKGKNLLRYIQENEVFKYDSAGFNREMKFDEVRYYKGAEKDFDWSEASPYDFVITVTCKKRCVDDDFTVTHRQIGDAKFYLRYRNQDPYWEPTIHAL